MKVITFLLGLSDAASHPFHLRGVTSKINQTNQNQGFLAGQYPKLIKESKD